MAEKLSRHYYRDLAPFRTLVHEKFGQAVGPPSAVLATTGGKLKKFRVLSGGEGVDLTLQDLPVPEAALIGRADDAQAARAMIDQISGELVRGLFKAVGRQPPKGKDSELVRKEDLGLGVPAFVFSGAWIERLFGDAKVAIDIEGDFRPHYFHHEGHLVVSTSPRLSKQILQSARAADPGWLPLGDGPGQTVAVGWVPGESIARLYRQMFDWVQAAGKQFGAGPEAMGPVLQIGEGLVELCGLLDRIEWSTTQAEKAQRTEWKVKFQTGRANKRGGKP